MVLSFEDSKIKYKVEPTTKAGVDYYIVVTFFFSTKSDPFVYLKVGGLAGLSHGKMSLSDGFGSNDFEFEHVRTIQLMIYERPFQGESSFSFVGSCLVNSSDLDKKSEPVESEQ